MKQLLTLNPPEPLAGAARQMLALVGSLDGTSAPVEADKIAALLKASPDYLPALAALAASQERSGDKTGLAITGEKLLSLAPDFAPAKKWLALLYAGDSAKRDRAYELAVQAREMYPEDPALNKALGILLVGKNDPQRAISLLRPCSQSLKDDPEVFYYLGLAQIQNKERVAGKANLQRALALKLSGSLAESAGKLLADPK